MKENKLKIVCVALTALILLTSCASSGSSRRNRDRDRDDDDSGSGFTRPSVTETEPSVGETEPSETVATAVPDDHGSSGVYSAPTRCEAYNMILTDYQEEILTVEQYTSVNDETECCALVDITGDGEDELFFLYCSDSENGYVAYGDEFVSAKLLVYTYDENTHEAVLMLERDHMIGFGGSGLFTDVALLDDGHLVFYSSYGDLDFFETAYEEYEVSGDELVRVTTVRHDSSMIEWDPEEVYEDEYWHDDTEIDVEAFADYADNYIGRAESAIFVTPWYSDSDNGAWGDNLVSLPSHAYTYTGALVVVNF